MAGLVVNDRAETSLPGLYAAGDSAGVAFQYLAGAFVLGEVAAEGASELARQRPTPVLSEHQVGEVEQRIEEAFHSEHTTSLSLDEFEYKVRRIVNDYVVSPKNAWKLQNAIQWMQRFRQELRGMVQVTDPHDVARYIEIGYIIDSSELSATAALTRTESRWGPRHRRTDYPERDDENWLKQILMQRAPDGTIKVECRPVSSLS
jgi:succinate dehydrogenase/fumarate reductase flavoprotein subunit